MYVYGTYKPSKVNCLNYANNVLAFRRIETTSNIYAHRSFSFSLRACMGALLITPYAQKVS